jgi:hypothetical protein
MWRKRFSIEKITYTGQSSFLHLDKVAYVASAMRKLRTKKTKKGRPVYATLIVKNLDTGHVLMANAG